MGTCSSGTALRLELIEINAQIINTIFLSNTHGMFRNFTKQLELMKLILGVFNPPRRIQQLIIINCTCTCEYHESISRYMTCDPLTESLMRESQSIVRISYISDANASTGYLVFPNCPYDYCNPLSVPIDLAQINGADRQCAFNRSGLLCGSCQPGFIVCHLTAHVASDVLPIGQ